MAEPFVGEQGSPDGPAGLLRTLAGAWFAPPLAIALALLLLVVNEAGYRTLNDIIDLERDDFLRLAGIAPEEADRIISLLDELTTDEAGGDDAARPVVNETAAE